MTDKEINQYMNKVAGFMVVSVVIWVILIIYQLVAGIFTIWWGYGVGTLLLMIYNIVNVIRYIKNLEVIRKCNSVDEAAAVVHYFENQIPICWIFMFINLIFGGVLGFIGCLYDLLLAYRVKKMKYELLCGNNAPNGGEFREID